MRFILALESDHHGGSSLGLLHPMTKLTEDDEEGNPYTYHPQLTKTQQYINSLRNKGIKEISKWAGRDRVIVLNAGDITEGTAHPALLVSDRLSDQLIIAEKNQEPWLDVKKVDTLRLAIGTPAHNWGEGSSESIVVRNLRLQYPKKDIRALYHGVANIKGFLIDYAHRGSGTGIRNWTEGNVARLYLRSLVDKVISMGKEPPGLVVRGHYHTLVRATDYRWVDGEYRRFDLIILPSLCGMNEYAHNVMASKRFVTLGMVGVEVVNGKIGQVRLIVEVLDMATEETI
jgi:hypothetical protein